jgi:hypothetical protein
MKSLILLTITAGCSFALQFNEVCAQVHLILLWLLGPI